MVNFNICMGFTLPTAKPMVAAAQPVGNAIAMQADTKMTSTTALGFMPPARAVLTAMGVMTATVPLFDRKVVMMTVITQNTVKYK